MCKFTKIIVTKQCLECLNCLECLKFWKQGSFGMKRKQIIMDSGFFEIIFWPWKFDDLENTSFLFIHRFLFCSGKDLVISCKEFRTGWSQRQLTEANGWRLDNWISIKSRSKVTTVNARSSYVICLKKGSATWLRNLKDMLGLLGYDLCQPWKGNMWITPGANRG